jgi:hypothetical protein
MREPGLLASMLPDAMADAFEREGDTELVERIEELARSRAREFNGATLLDVRAARRAAVRGEKDKARKLAQKVIDAWSVADERVPAVKEMQKLLGSLR